jgi:hypothetical protein
VFRRSIIGIEVRDSESGNGKRAGLPLPGVRRLRSSSESLTAEVTILAFLHILGKVLPDSPPFGVDDPGLLQTADRFFGSLHPRRIVGIFLRFLILKPWDRNRLHSFDYNRKAVSASFTSGKNILDSSQLRWDHETNRMWSLWDFMNRFELHALVSHLQNMSMMVVGFLVRSAGSELTPAQRAMAIECVTRTKTILSFVDFPDSCSKIEKSIQYMSTNAVCDASALGTELRNITEFVMMEADKKRFLYVAADRSQYLDKSDLFGEAVTNSFPSAVVDIREAGNCLAAECNTAAVFHLMRTAEWGLRAICSHFGLRKAKSIKRSGKAKYTPMSHVDWETMLNQLHPLVDAKINKTKRGPDKQALQEYYYPILQDIRGIRNAWRNHVMHSRAEYTRLDAAAIFDHVRRLMIKISLKISEV